MPVLAIPAPIGNESAVVESGDQNSVSGSCRVVFPDSNARFQNHLERRTAGLAGLRNGDDVPKTAASNGVATT